MSCLYIEAQGCVPVLLENLHGMSCSGACWPLGGAWFGVAFLYSGNLWSSLYYGASSLWVGFYQWLVKVSSLGRLVLVLVGGAGFLLSGVQWSDQ